MVQDFWQRWCQCYLHQLQARNKWKVATRNLEVGDLFALKNEPTPSNKWALGRVLATYPDGDDGIVRVVNVKTASGIFRRPTAKLVLILHED